MGMFDTLKSSYDLGPGFTKELQTKDLECFMCHYWIDPTGRLFQIDYTGTQDFAGFDDGSIFGKLKFQRNGNHGKVRPIVLNLDIIVYPSVWDCKYAPFPEKQLSFVDGIIVRVKDIEKRK